MTSLPAAGAPVVTRSRPERMVAPALTVGALGAATLALHLRDPHVSGSWGICPSAALGFWCPGCGGLRAVNDLTHLDVLSAASSNLALVLAGPFVLLGLGVWTLDRWQGRSRRIPERVTSRGAYALVAALLVFMLLRNLPWFGWLAP